MCSDNVAYKKGASSIARIQKRARSKHFTNEYTLALVDTKSRLTDQYWKTYWCGDEIRETSDGRFLSKFCEKRWCTTCNRIRTARLLNTYMPLVNQWNEPTLTTLTRKNIPLEQLNSEVGNLVKLFQKCKDNLRRTYKIKLKGTRNMETTFNPKTKEFNVHFHCIIEGKQNAETLVKLWVKTSNKDGHRAELQAQDTRSIGKDAKDLIEAFKYSNKIVNTVTVNGKKERRIYAYAFDAINQAMLRRRAFQTFGFTKADSAEVEKAMQELDETINKRLEAIKEKSLKEKAVSELKSLISSIKDPIKRAEFIDEYLELSQSLESDQGDIVVNSFQWHHSATDWVTKDGELLTGYEPSESMKELISGIVRKPIKSPTSSL